MAAQYERLFDDFGQFEKERDLAIDEVYIAHGYTDTDGEPADEPMKEATLEILRSHAVANTKQERARKALSQHALFKLVWSGTPGAQGAPRLLNHLDKAVYDTLTKRSWGLTQKSASGWIQRELGKDGGTLVLCHTEVEDNNKTKGVYLTDNPQLIAEDAIDPEMVSFFRRAQRLRRDLDQIAKRHPELTAVIAEKMELELTKVAAELTFDGTVGALES